MSTWEDFNEHLLFHGEGRSPTRWCYSFVWTAENLRDTPPLDRLGYKAPEGKIKRLKHYYFPEAEIEKAARAIARGNSATFPLVNNDKTFFGAKKHCMQRGRVDNRGELHLYYRSTEATKKWGADLVFIDEVLIPALGASPPAIHFNFERAGLTVYYMPVWSLNDPNFLDRLTGLKWSNPKAYRWVIMGNARQFHKFPTLKSIEDRLFEGSGMYKSPARALQAYYRMAQKDHWFKPFILDEERSIKQHEQK